MLFVMQTNSVLYKAECTFLYTTKVKFKTQDRAMFQADSDSPGASPGGPRGVRACVCVMNKMVDCV